MRIRVKGELTEDRLKEALALITAKGHGVTCYFDGFLIVQPATAAEPSSVAGKAVGGNLILEEVDEDASMGNGEWNGPIPAYISGVVDNSHEAVERRRLYRLERENHERLRSQEHAREEQLIHEHLTDKEIFSQLISRFGDEIINAINKEIAKVWDEVKPVFLHSGKAGKAGEPRPMPQLQLRGTTVSFHGFNATGTTKKVLTPLSERDRRLGASPIWKYTEWAERTVPRIRAVIDEFALLANLARVNIGTGHV